MTTPSSITQEELKALVGQAALQYVVPGEIVGVGTGSTVNHFITALASMKDQIRGAVSSSEASTQRLKALGIPVFDANDVESLAVYIDGADEIDGQGHMVKGAGLHSRAKRSSQRWPGSSFASPMSRSGWMRWASSLCQWK